VAAFEQGLLEAGYSVGHNLRIEYRSADGAPEQLPRLATELVDLNVDVIVAVTAQAALAAKQATSTIPIVIADIGDPVGVGLVASLARPGGNVTGPTSLGPQLTAKRMELLKTTVPSLSRVAVLWSPANPANASAWRDSQAAAEALGVQVQSLEIESAAGVEKALAAATRDGAEAILPLTGPLIGARLEAIVSFAAEHRLPAMYWGREFVEVGGLMAYAPDYRARFGRAAYYVDRILKGTKPADLPVEQPMTFDFVVNMKTARELGITFPQEILLQVTEVVQ
jgi:putative ABC transport system substrate-binding protein